MLTDSGSTHKFISEKVASFLCLHVVPTKSFTVCVANGERLKSQGRFEKVPVNMQGIHFLLTLCALPIASLDLVLRV